MGTRSLIVETFEYTIPPGHEGAGYYAWDVTLAKRLVAAAGREPWETDPENLAGAVAKNVVVEGKVRLADVTAPGIAAPLPCRGGELVLIDGNHRAARCVREGRSFRIHVLTPEEAAACLLVSPALAATAEQFPLEGG